MNKLQIIFSTHLLVNNLVPLVFLIEYIFKTWAADLKAVTKEILWFCTQKCVWITDER
jgi:hypothetical protein